MIGRPARKLIWITILIASTLLSACSSRDSDSNAFEGTTTPSVGRGSDLYGNDDFEIEETESVYAFRQNSPYANILKECVLINTLDESCTVAKLPFIGDGTLQPTIDDVMERVLVTHNWMGQRFEEVLKTAPTEVMTMFSSATAVLIGSNVRPSFYTTTTGAIQVDPAYLWSSVEEKRSISTVEDFRSDYGIDLQFWFLSRTADRNGDRLTPYYSLDDDSVRPVEDINVPLVRLLVHELTHATDFMPRAKIAGLDTTLSVFDTIDSTVDDWLSPKLSNAYPLKSDDLQGFAEVRYRGLDATKLQQATTSADMGELMALDGAIQFYSYTSIREDLAQLVEGVVMAYRYDSIGNIGFTQKPANENSYTCDDLLVSWGQRNRLADPLVNVRARAATDLVLSLSPEMTDYLDNSLGDIQFMNANVGWCDNQSTAALVAAESSNRTANRLLTPESGPLFIEMMQADSIVHPEDRYHD